MKKFRFKNYFGVIVLYIFLAFCYFNIGCVLFHCSQDVIAHNQLKVRQTKSNVIEFCNGQGINVNSPVPGKIFIDNKFIVPKKEELEKQEKRYDLDGENN